jgi:hypothetical protein
VVVGKDFNMTVLMDDSLAAAGERLDERLAEATRIAWNIAMYVHCTTGPLLAERVRLTALLRRDVQVDRLVQASAQLFNGLGAPDGASVQVKPYEDDLLPDIKEAVGVLALLTAEIETLKRHLDEITAELAQIVPVRGFRSRWTDYMLWTCPEGPIVTEVERAFSGNWEIHVFRSRPNGKWRRRIDTIVVPGDSSGLPDDVVADAIRITLAAHAKH